MIKQINQKNIDGYKSFMIFSTHKSQDIFFEIQGETTPDVLKKFNKSLCDYIDNNVKKKKYPEGIFNVETIIENKVFRITYSPKNISEEKVIDFAKSLNL